MSSRSPIVLIIVSENRFSGKTYFIQLVPDGDRLLVRLGAKAVHEVPTYLALGVPGLGQEGYVLRDY